MCDMTDAINCVTCNQPGELQVTNVTCNSPQSNYKFHSICKQAYAK